MNVRNDWQGKEVTFEFESQSQSRPREYMKQLLPPTLRSVLGGIKYPDYPSKFNPGPTKLLNQREFVIESLSWRIFSLPIPLKNRSGISMDACAKLLGLNKN